MMKGWVALAMLLAAFRATAQNETGSDMQEAARVAEVHWYNMPLTWIIAAGAMLALLIVLTRGGSKSQE